MCCNSAAEPEIGRLDSRSPPDLRLGDAAALRYHGGGAERAAQARPGGRGEGPTVGWAVFFFPFFFLAFWGQQTETCCSGCQLDHVTWKPTCGRATILSLHNRPAEPGRLFGSPRLGLRNHPRCAFLFGRALGLFAKLLIPCHNGTQFGEKTSWGAESTALLSQAGAGHFDRGSNGLTSNTGTLAEPPGLARGPTPVVFRCHAISGGFHKAGWFCLESRGMPPPFPRTHTHTHRNSGSHLVFAPLGTATSWTTTSMPRTCDKF